MQNTQTSGRSIPLKICTTSLTRTLTRSLVPLNPFLLRKAAFTVLRLRRGPQTAKVEWRANARHRLQKEKPHLVGFSFLFFLPCRQIVSASFLKEELPVSGLACWHRLAQKPRSGTQAFCQET